MTRCATLILLLGLLLTPPALGQDAVSLTDVQAAYDALDGLRAAFTQVISSDFAGDTTRIEGTVLLSGNKYRVQTPTQTVVTDGQTTWIYTPADSQVVVNDAEQDASTVTPETFLTASADRYRKTASTPVTRDGTPHVKLTLTATDSTARFKEATLWVRRTDRVVTRMRATDRNGSTLDLRLRNLAINPPLADDPFTFTPPEGIEVIDLRQSE
jgi:outer membrane lipoprotein carrier protein